jgi:hypothetical protein
MSSAMTTGLDAKAVWIERVLGVELPELAWSGAFDVYKTTIEKVVHELSSLQQVLKASDFVFLHPIADGGMAGIFGDHGSSVLEAMREMGTSDISVRPKAAEKARASIDAFLAHLDGDPRVQACDENPFGVSVTIMQTLGNALKELHGVLDKVV